MVQAFGFSDDAFRLRECGRGQDGRVSHGRDSGALLLHQRSGALHQSSDGAALTVMGLHLDHHRVESLDVRVKTSGVLARRASLGCGGNGALSSARKNHRAKKSSCRAS